MWYERVGEGYRTTAKKSFKGVIIPAGFRFNVSSPKWAHWFVHPHDERFLEAACYHDYLLLELGWSRPKAAWFWYDVLKIRKDVSWFKKIVTTLALAIWPGR